MENKRQKAILEIVESCAVETQEELIEKLSQRGIDCAQATISRDIKRLHLVKEPYAGKYRYTVSQRRAGYDVAERLQDLLRECGTHVAHANNLIVFRTMPGLGMAAGAAFDSMLIGQMLGCVSGDDTVIIIMRDNASAEEFSAKLAKICGERT